jgi:hypothetical protein
VTDDGEVPNIPCRRRGHNSNSFCSKDASNLPLAQAEISGSLIQKWRELEK